MNTLDWSVDNTVTVTLMVVLSFFVAATAFRIFAGFRKSKAEA